MPLTIAPGNKNYADIVVTGTANLAGRYYNVDQFIIRAGGLVTVEPYDGSLLVNGIPSNNTGHVWIEARRFIIEAGGTLNASGAGHSGGGGGGAAGGCARDATPGGGGGGGTPRPYWYPTGNGGSGSGASINPGGPGTGGPGAGPFGGAAGTGGFSSNRHGGYLSTGGNGDTSTDRSVFMGGGAGGGQGGGAIAYCTGGQPSGTTGHANGGGGAGGAGGGIIIIKSDIIEVHGSIISSNMTSGDGGSGGGAIFGCCGGNGGGGGGVYPGSGGGGGCCGTGGGSGTSTGSSLHGPGPNDFGEDGGVAAGGGILFEATHKYDGLHAGPRVRITGTVNNHGYSATNAGTIKIFSPSYDTTSATILTRGSGLYANRAKVIAQVI